MSRPPTADSGTMRIDESWAREADEADTLSGWRDKFHVPASSARGGRDAVYLVGNSLGCMPRGAKELVIEELDAWRDLGLGAHHKPRHGWYPYAEFVREPLARLVGARPHEVVAMNSLTVNLHLMMASFYQPTDGRFRIVIEDAAFPSDSYAVSSQIRWHGRDPAEALVRLRPREAERALRDDDIVQFLRDQGESVALVLLGGVNYLTGQWFDMARITAAARDAGARIGWDLAHAAGNVPLSLHEWGPDFAVWCSYKYLNAGPGSPGGAFVHDRNARDTSLVRLAGWWGNDPASRFQMTPDFEPVEAADAWALSNPPILSTAPLIKSLEIFDQVGMSSLRAKSERLTSYLRALVGRIPGMRVATPDVTERRGAQLSLVPPGNVRAIHGALIERGIFADFREPDIIRVAPVPLYNSFRDVWTFANELSALVGGSLDG